MNCEHANPEFIATPESTHHGKYICPDCGRFIGWAPKPETVERQKAQRKLIAQLSEDSMPLSPWERGFIASLAKQEKLSPKQADKLNEVARRHHL